MDFFEFILIITSVIYALCLAPLLTGVVRLLQTESPIRHFIPHSIWAVVMFFTVIIVWWTMWGFRNVEWHFATFVYVVIEPTILFIACSLTFPQKVDGAEVDLEAHMTKVWRPLLLAMFVLSSLIYLDGVVLADEPLWHSARPLQILMLATTAWAFIYNRRITLYVTPVVLSIAITIIVTMRFWSPPG